MQSRKRLYLYPITKITGRQGGNTYILNLKKYLLQHVDVINEPTGLGLLDVVLKMPKCDVIYFNWIEDVVDKRFGFLQVVLLAGIVLFSKLLNIKIVWFVHNNLSHKKANLGLKKRIVVLMEWGADVILSHSGEARIANSKKQVAVFEHPLDPYTPLPLQPTPAYDLLIWGTVNPYKGVEEFLTFNQSAATLKEYKILIAGKFASPEYFKQIAALKASNITIEDKILSEEELIDYFSKSRFVLFTYNSASVLSSAALCKTLSYGKTIIGPNTGSFKELGQKGLIYTYSSFEALEALLPGLPLKETEPGYADALQQYIAQHSWPAFARFVELAIDPKKEPAFSPVL